MVKFHRSNIAKPDKQTNMVTLLGICSVLFAIINISNAQNPCKTPDNWDGKCMALSECRPLIGLHQKTDRSTEQQTFLTNSQCGGDDSEPLVCCPNRFTIDDLPECGVEVKDRIFGGEQAGLTEFPWLALLHYIRPDTYPIFGCGGSLINENYVLTAAHCIRGSAIVGRGHILEYVRLGETDQRTNPDCQGDEDSGETVECADPVQDFPVAEVIVHEGYDPSSRSQPNDIALIRLPRPVKFTNFTRPVCLPIRDLQNRNYDGSVFTVAGFGKTENVSRSEVKMKLDVNNFDLEQCTNVYRTLRINLGNSVLCAGGGGGKDSCTGDSGGPLVADETKDDKTFSYLVGIVSIGYSKCGTQGIPGVYTRVDKHIDWILDHMRK